MRALTPWPGAVSSLRGEDVKVIEAIPLDGDGGVPGTVLGLRGPAVGVACGGGSILGLVTLQRPGRRPVAAPAFANGERLEPGERFD